MTYDDLLMQFFRGLLTLDQWGALADQAYPVAATPARTPLPTLADSAPTWFAMLAAEAPTTELQLVA